MCARLREHPAWRRGGFVFFSVNPSLSSRFLPQLRARGRSLLCAWVLAAALAQAAPVNFDLPAQPAAGALAAFIRQSGEDVLFVSDGVKDVRTGAVVGAYEPAEALKLLLAGTPLVATPSGAGRWTVVRKAESAPFRAPAPAEATPRAEARATPEATMLPAFTLRATRDRSYTADDTLGVSRIRTSLLETPQTVVVFGRELVDDLAIGRTFDAIKYVGGVSEGNVNYAQDRATLRGLVATDNYVDGALILWGETNADPALIERIEVIKGPAPILFANSPAAGLINKITKNPLPEARRTLKATVGDFDANRAELDFTGPVTRDGKLLYRLVAARQDSDGWYDRTYLERWVVAPALTYRFNETAELTLKYNLSDTKFSSYNGIPLDRLSREVIAVNPRTNFADPANFRTDRLDHLALTGTAQLAPWLGVRLAMNAVWVDVSRDESRVGGRAAPGVTGQSTEFFGTLPVTGDRTSLVRNSQYFERDSLGLTLQNDYVARYRTGPLEHTTLGGVELRRGDWTRLGTALVFDTINPFGPLPATVPARGAVNARFAETSHDAKYYLLQEVGLLDRRLLASFGATRNFNRFRAANALNPAAARAFRNAAATTLQGGLVGKVTERVALFAGYNESFQPNNALDTAGRQLPNLTGRQTEVGVKARLWRERLRLTAAYFDIKASTSRAAPPGRPIGAVDFNTQTSKGFDADIALSVNREIEIIAGAARFNLEDNTTLSFPNVAETTASAWARYTFVDGPAKGLSFGLGANHIAARDGTAGANRDGTGNTFNNPANNFANVTFRLPARTVAEALVAYTWTDWRLAVNVDNLFDKDYVAAVRFANTLQPGYGRNVKATVTYSF